MMTQYLEKAELGMNSEKPDIKGVTFGESSKITNMTNTSVSRAFILHGRESCIKKKDIFCFLFSFLLFFIQYSDDKPRLLHLIQYFLQQHVR